MKCDQVITIKNLIKERYSDAKTLFLAGSVSENCSTCASDLDLVIIYESIPNAYREALALPELHFSLEGMGL